MVRRKKTKPADGGANKRGPASTGVKSQFIANMSHELRTPLNAIIGFSEMMRNEVYGPLGDQKYVEYIGDIYESGQHLLSIVNDILDLSKVEAGRMSLNEDAVDLSDVIRRAAFLIGPLAEKAGVNVRTQSPSQVTILAGDERLLVQIVLNLLSNAVKFTPKNGTVSVEIRAKESGSIAIFVRDTGHGIAPADMARAMEPFGQVHAAQSGTPRGTGLGLPLVKSFVELHGGHFELQSKLGVGTTAIVIFPESRRMMVAARPGAVLKPRKPADAA
jgi:signal transduction histidine kinase